MSEEDKPNVPPAKKNTYPDGSSSELQTYGNTPVKEKFPSTQIFVTSLFDKLKQHSLQQSENDKVETTTSLHATENKSNDQETLATSATNVEGILKRTSAYNEEIKDTAPIIIEETVDDDISMLSEVSMISRSRRVSFKEDSNSALLKKFASISAPISTNASANNSSENTSHTIVSYMSSGTSKESDSAEEMPVSQQVSTSTLAEYQQSARRLKSTTPEELEAQRKQFQEKKLPHEEITKDEKMDVASEKSIVSYEESITSEDVNKSKSHSITVNEAVISSETVSKKTPQSESELIKSRNVSFREESNTKILIQDPNVIVEAAPEKPEDTKRESKTSKASFVRLSEFVFQGVHERYKSVAPSLDAGPMSQKTSLLETPASHSELDVSETSEISMDESGNSSFISMYRLSDIIKTTEEEKLIPSKYVSGMIVNTLARQHNMETLQASKYEDQEEENKKSTSVIDYFYKALKKIPEVKEFNLESVTLLKSAGSIKNRDHILGGKNRLENLTKTFNELKSSIQEENLFKRTTVESDYEQSFKERAATILKKRSENRDVELENTYKSNKDWSFYYFDEFSETDLLAATQGNRINNDCVSERKSILNKIRKTFNCMSCTKNDK